MKLRNVLLTALLAFMAAVLVQPVQAQRATIDDVLKSAKPGQWMEISGTAQMDNSVMATKVKILTGDFADDDWEVYGKVRRIDPAGKQFDMLNLRIRTNDDTSYESADDSGNFNKFSDLKTGLLVEAEGTLLKDGTFLADEVQDESSDPKKAEKQNLVKFKGKVQSVNREKRAIVLLGVTFYLNEQTKIRSAIK